MTPVQRNLLIGAAGLGVLLYAGTASAAPRGGGKGGGGGGNGGGNGGGGKARPVGPPNTAPAGAGRATVAPHLNPGDPPKYANGLLLHATPNSNSPAKYPEDASPTSKHANTRDVVSILQLDVPDEAGTGRLWAKILTVWGEEAYVSQKGPKDPGRAGTPNISNFTNVTPPTGQALAFRGPTAAQQDMEREVAQQQFAGRMIQQRGMPSTGQMPGLGWAPWGGLSPAAASMVGQSPESYVNPAEQAAWRAYENARAQGQGIRTQLQLYGQAADLRARYGGPGTTGAPGFSPAAPRGVASWPNQRNAPRPIPLNIRRV